MTTKVNDTEKDDKDEATLGNKVSCTSAAYPRQKSWTRASCSRGGNPSFTITLTSLRSFLLSFLSSTYYIHLSFALLSSTSHYTF